LAALALVGVMKSRIPILAMAVLAPLYITFRMNGEWSGSTITDLAGMINDRRASSMQFRLDNETMLVDKALQQPVFGWGRWGRARVFRDDGKDLTVTDGLWVIALGNTGMVGLIALNAAMLLPVLALARRLPAHLWRHPYFAGVAASGVIVIVFAIDSLVNAFPNPLYMAAGGGIVTLLSIPIDWRRFNQPAATAVTTPRRPRWAARPRAGPGFPPAASGNR
jgi:hypothetical protein